MDYFSAGTNKVAVVEIEVAVSGGSTVKTNKGMTMNPTVSKLC